MSKCAHVDIEIKPDGDYEVLTCRGCGVVRKRRAQASISAVSAVEQGNQDGEE